MAGNLTPYVLQCHPVHGAASLGVGVGADAVGDLAERLQDGAAVEVVEIPAGGAGLQRELAEGGVQSGQGVAQEHAPAPLASLRRPENADPGKPSNRSAGPGDWLSSLWYSGCMPSTAILVPS